MDVLLILAIVLAVGYYVSLRVHPFTSCGRCKGHGRNAGSTRRRFGKCGKCGGSGKKDRFGTRFFRKH